MISSQLSGTRPAERHSVIGPQPLWRSSPFVWLVAALAGIALALCWPAGIIQRAKRAAAEDWRITLELKQLGVDASIRNGRLVAIDFPPGQPVSSTALDRLQQLPGAAELKTLSLSGRPFSDNQLGLVGGLQSLTRLTLSDTLISDAGLAHLRPLKQLNHLELAGNGITDDGLAQLCGLPLKGLDLSRTRVTDAGMNTLAEIQTLEYVGLVGTAVGQAGVDQLQKLPQLRYLHLDGGDITRDGRRLSPAR